MGAGETEGVRLADLAVTPGPPLTDAALPGVRVVIPTLGGPGRLAECLDALLASRYPREKLAAVVVDNGSRDGAPAELARARSGVRVIVNARNEGFAAACNRGAEGTEALVVAFLNDDVVVEPDWLRELVSPIARGECACTGGKLLAWDGATLDWGGGGASFQGFAIAHGWREVPGPEHDVPRRTLFACGGAMAIDAAVFRAVGGFDAEFFAYYEDLDLGWRLWLAGHEVHTAPRAVARHEHSRTSRRFPPEQIRLLQVRNALLTCFKNYDRESLDRLLPALFALGLRRAWVMSRIDDAPGLRIEAARPRERSLARRALHWLRTRGGRYPIHPLAAADFVALNDLLGAWDHWSARRAEVQALRRRSDAEIFRLFLRPLWCVEGEPGYVELQRGILAHYGADALFAGCTVEGLEPRK